MGRGGGEGRVPSLMTAAVEKEVFDSYFFLSSLMCRPRGIRLKRERNEVFPILISFLSSLMCRPWGIRLKREHNEVCVNPKGISPWVTFSAGRVRGVACRFGFTHDH